MVSDIIRDDKGNLSAARVAFMMIIGIFAGTWSYLSIKSGEMQPIDMEQLLMILGSFGFKVYQKSIEV